MCRSSVGRGVRTVAELLRVVQGGVFAAAVFEGGVGQVLAGQSGAGGEQGGIEEGSLVVQSHAASVHQLHPTDTLKSKEKYMRWRKH